MSVRKLWVACAAIAVIVGVSPAQAATSEPNSLSRFSLAAASFFQPPQRDADGSVYGVRASAAATHGQGSLEIISQGSQLSNSPTPDPCSTGWCDTAHHIAATAFGWNFSATGAGVVIGIVDTGIDLNHPDFAGRVLTGGCIVSSVNACTNAWDQVGGDTATFPGPNNTHGTHVTGIAAGALTGLATSADILPVKVCSSSAGSCDGVDAGIVYAASHGASVINVSIGGPILSTSDIASFQTAIADGALLVVAGGNSGNKDPSSGFLAGAALQDGVRGSMIVVGATTAGGTGGHGQIASFSQVPSTQCEVHGGQRYCMRDYFVVAPGYNIWSTVGNGVATGANYGYLSGTSMATPYVTGTAAVIKGMWPTLTSSQIASIIFQTADDVGAPGTDPIYGRGAVDITKALGPAGAAIVATHSFNVGGPAASISSTVQAPSAVAGLMGDAAATSKLSSLGVMGATQSLVSGPLSVAVMNSSLLKSAVMIDSFGRTFHVDLTKADYNQGFDFTNYFLQSPFTSYSPFAFSGMGPLGKFTASGYAVDSVMPRLLSGELLTQDRNRYTVRDMELTSEVSDRLSINMGFNMDLQGRFNGYDLQASRAYDGLFISGSAMNSPYQSFTDGGNFVGATMALADDLHFNFGQSELQRQTADYEVPVFSYLTQVEGPQTQYNQRTASTTMAGMDWDFASWGGLGLTASNTVEQHGLLGGVNSGALAVASGANTSAIGLSGRVGFGDGWVTTVSYSEGITQLDLKASSLVSSVDTLHSRAYGVAIAKHGLFGADDSLGLAVSRPIQVYSGGVEFTAANGIDANGNLTLASEHDSLASKTPETDLELGYVTTFFDGALALQANAAWQMNLQGQDGLNSLAVLSRAKINF